MALLLAPYNDSMKLGQGFNSYTHELCIDGAVEFGKDAINTTESPAQDVSYSSRFVEKLSDVINAMNVSYSSSIKKGTVDIGGSSSTIDETTFKTSDLNALVSVKVTNQTTMAETNGIFKPIKNITPGSPDFNEIYGDCYISGFIKGGSFTGILSIKIHDSVQKEAIKKSIKEALSPTKKAAATEFTLSSLDDKTHESNVAKILKGTEVTISVSWMGGGQIKDENVTWDFDSMYAAAAAFPARVAACPQKTWAILTKYKSNRTYIDWSSTTLNKTLEYDQINTYTAELFDSYMDYKMLLSQVQDIISHIDQYGTKVGPNGNALDNAIEPNMPTLLSVRSAMRDEQAKIVEAIEVLSLDPTILKRKATWSQTHRAPVVEKILMKALGENWALNFKKNGKPLKSGRPQPTMTPKKEDTATEEGTSDEETFTLVKEDPQHVGSPKNKPKNHQRDFDFSSLVPPEIWEDLLPVRKFPDATGFSQGGFSAPVGSGSSQTGFIPPTDSGVPASALGLVQFNFADTPSPEMKIKHAEILKDKAALEAERNEAISKAEAIELQYNDSQTELGEAQNKLQEAMKEINGLKRSQEQLNAELANASRGSEGAQQAHKAEVAKLRSEAENAQKVLNAELGKVRLEAENTKKALTADLANARSGTENVQRELNNLRGSTAETIARLNNEVHQRDRRAIPFPQRQGNRVWIMAVVWGNQFIYDENVINRCYQFAHSKQRFQFNNDWFGGDNMPGVRKTGLVLYKYDNSGLIRYLYGWEHDTYGFDGW